MLVSNQTTKLIVIPTLMIVILGALARWLTQESQEVTSEVLTNLDTQHQPSLSEIDERFETPWEIPDALDSMSPLKLLQGSTYRWREEARLLNSQESQPLQWQSVHPSYLPEQWLARIQDVLQDHWSPQVLSIWSDPIAGMPSEGEEVPGIFLGDTMIPSQSSGFEPGSVELVSFPSANVPPLAILALSLSPAPAPLTSEVAFQLFATPDAPGSIAIGAAEGTRTVTGEKTAIYWGHFDPANRARNQGTFSYQHEASGPKDADWKQLKRIHGYIEEIQEQAAEHGIFLSTLELVAGVDLANQAPATIEDYVQHLHYCQRQGLQGAEAVLKARMQSFVNPKTNRLEAGGLGNSWETLKADQSRRLKEIQNTLTVQGVWEP